MVPLTETGREENSQFVFVKMMAVVMLARGPPPEVLFEVGT